MSKVKLSEITSLITKGTTPTTIGYSFQNEGIHFVKIESIAEDGSINFDKLEHISYECNEKMKRSILFENDILFSIAGALGRTAIVTKEVLPANTNQALSIIRVTEKALPKYVQYALKSEFIFNQFQKQKQGVAQLNLSLKNIGDLEIPLPPLETQKQIAKTLDTATELLAMRKQQLTELDNLIKSVYYEMFGDPVENEKGWDISTIDKACLKILGGGTPSKGNPEFYTGNIPWVTPKDMKAKWITESIDYINEDAINKSSAKLVPANSVLMVIRSGILKRKLPVAINRLDVAINQDMKAFIPNASVNVEYLLYYFISMQNNILKNVRAVTADNIEFSLIRNLLIPVPPIELQTQFATIVTKIEEQKALVKKAINETQYLFDSLMAQYFE